MPKVELGPIGAVVSPGEGSAHVETAVALEEMGYTTVWLTGGPMSDLDQVAAVVRATRRVRVATGIIPVDRFPAEDVVGLYTELEASHPGRFVVGLGGAHGPNPLRTLNAFLDRLGDAVPPGARLMAALGPRMLDLARERAAGAFPVLVTPGYTAEARARLGEAATLAVEQVVAVETDPERARAAGRMPLRFLSQSPAYRASFHRMGFTEDEVTRLDDRLVDALVPWGDAATVAARVRDQLAAGADHVAVSITMDPGEADPLDRWRRLAAQLTGDHP